MVFRSAPDLSTGWLVLLCVVAGMAVAGVSYAASPVPRITPDSTNYMTGAERLADEGRFESCAERITVFAPGYSAAMALLVAAGLDATQAARVVNALATLALVLGAGLLARAGDLSERASAVVALGVAASYATLRDGALVWSEPLFCAILAWLLVLALDSGRGLEVRVSARVAGVVLLTWALLMTRHSGAFVVPAVILAGWLGSSAATHRVARLGALCGALLVAPAAWWLRNVTVDGHPFGRRSASPFTALDVLGQLPDGLSSLVLPAAVPLALRLAIAAPLVAAAILAWRTSSESSQARVVVRVLTVEVVVYASAVTLAAMRTVVDPIDTRLISPILAPMAVLVALGVCARRTRTERWLGAFALLVVGLSIILAPGVVWRGHEAERTLASIPNDVSCARWPARYSGAL